MNESTITPIEINRDNVLEQLHAAVMTQGPDFVYNPSGDSACVYYPVVHPTQLKDRPKFLADPRTKTGCLIGTQLSLLGVPREALELFVGAISNLATSPTTPLAAYVILTPTAARIMQVAQNVQDRGYSWGSAEAAAIRVYNGEEYTDVLEDYPHFPDMNDGM